MVFLQPFFAWLNAELLTQYFVADMPPPIRTLAKMPDHNLIFVAGLHRSGTSLLHEILRSHPDISGIVGSPAWNYEDEGQFLQSVYPQGSVFGGPGKFAFDNRSHMTDEHELVSVETSNSLFSEWSQYWDLGKKYLIEKSPPNIVRTRFLQALFPKARFIVVLRHPVPVAYATIKWSKSSIPELIDHWLIAYERYLADMPKLSRVFTLRYETFVKSPQPVLNEIYDFLEIESTPLSKPVSTSVNEKYIRRWRKDRRRPFRPIMPHIAPELESRALALGYSLEDPKFLPAITWSL